MKTEETFFVKRFKRIMFERGFNQQDLSEKLGISRTMISRWLTGVRNPSLGSLKKISAVLDVPLNYFIESSSEENKTKAENIREDKNCSDINSITSRIDLLNEKNRVLEEAVKRHDTENILLNKEIEYLKKEIDLLRKLQPV